MTVKSSNGTKMLSWVSRKLAINSTKEFWLYFGGKVLLLKGCELPARFLCWKFDSTKQNKNVPSTLVDII